MATLEKIRSKSVLLFTIIIVALLAFILGDFLTSGRTYFGSGTTVAKAGSAEVDYPAFKNSIDNASNQARNNNQDVDNDELTQQVISELLFKQLLDEEYEKLGITVTDSEISNAMTGAMPHRAAQQFIYTLSQQLGLPMASGAAVYDAMMNPAKYSLTPEIGAQLKQMWAAQEDQVAETLKQEKFYRLIGGLFTASEADARALYNDNLDTRHIAYTSKDYSTIADDKVSVSDDDIKAQWAKEKALYRIAEPTRAVDYIIVNIEPSKEDRLAGQKEVEDGLLALSTQPGTEGISGNTRFVTTRVNASRSQISDNNVKAFVDSAKVGQAALLSHVRDTYTLAKLLGTSSDVDSINVSVIAGAQGTDLDSVLAKINGGEAWASFMNTESTQGQDSVWTTLVNNTALTPSTKALLLAATPGVPFIATDTVQGQAYSAIYKVNRRHNPVTVYDVAVANYTIDPSSTTIADLTGNLNSYIGEHSSAEDFTANAAEAGYNVLSALVSASSPHVGPVPDSRGTVKWVMDAKKGQVSPVIGDTKQSYIMAVAVKDVYDGEYLPWNCYAFTDRLKARAINAKKAEQLMAQYSGKASDLAGYAKLMGTEVVEGDASFMSPILATIGLNESALQGQIAAAKEGVVTGPTEGNNAIVVFEVKSINKEGRPYDFNEYGARFNQTLGTGLFNPFQLLLGDRKVENNSLNFVQSSVN